MDQKRKVEIQNQLFHSFIVNEQKFIPICFIDSVEEPEFGCEGRPDNQLVYGVANVITKQEEQQWKIEEKELYRTGLDDKMWIGYFENNSEKIHYVSVRNSNKSYRVVEKGDWISYYKEIVRV